MPYRYIYLIARYKFRISITFRVGNSQCKERMNENIAALSVFRSVRLKLDAFCAQCTLKIYLSSVSLRELSEKYMKNATNHQLYLLLQMIHDSAALLFFDTTRYVKANVINRYNKVMKYA